MYNIFVSLGCVAAAVLSFVVNKSFWWCVLHMLLGWLYIIYWICSYSNIPEWIFNILVM